MIFVTASILGRSLRIRNPAASWKNIRFYSDDEKVTKQPDKETREAKKDVAKKKLNQLLEMMVKEEVVHAKAKLELAKPKKKRSEPGAAKAIDSATRKSVENKIIAAVKEVAASVVGDVKQTESELLAKLLNSTKPEHTSEAQASLSDIVRGMKIDRTEKPEAVSRAQQVRELLGAAEQNPQVQKSRRPPPRLRKRELSDVQVPVVPIDLFGADPLGIFTRDGAITSTVTNDCPKTLSTWDMLLQRDLRLAVTHPPSNYFQQMIQWTDQGKLWRFPIDNEQGMDEEHSIYFTEHVFLEQHLEPWCPPRGPVRQFMQLVCVGMSKNPYMSASTKRGHIAWYREYFAERRQLLEDLGAISASNAPQETKEPDSSCSKSL